MERASSQYPAMLDGPGIAVSDSRELLLGYLDWYRDALFRKLAGLSERQLRTPVEPLGWSPLGLVKHLGWVERRWMRWGFDAEDVEAEPPGGEPAEFTVATEEPVEGVVAGYRTEVEHSRRLTARAALTDRAKLGGRFTAPDFAAPEDAPSLVRILFHLLQEYARHVGHLDIARELIDGVTGE